MVVIFVRTPIYSIDRSKELEIFAWPGFGGRGTSTLEFKVIWVQFQNLVLTCGREWRCWCVVQRRGEGVSLSALTVSRISNHANLLAKLSLDQHIYDIQAKIDSAAGDMDVYEIRRHDRGMCCIRVCIWVSWWFHEHLSGSLMCFTNRMPGQVVVMKTCKRRTNAFLGSYIRLVWRGMWQNRWLNVPDFSAISTPIWHRQGCSNR